jgi:hypothetical protein
LGKKEKKRENPKKGKKTKKIYGEKNIKKATVLSLYILEY